MILIDKMMQAPVKHAFTEYFLRGKGLINKSMTDIDAFVRQKLVNLCCSNIHYRDTKVLQIYFTSSLKLKIDLDLLVAIFFLPLLFIAISV